MSITTDWKNWTKDINLLKQRVDDAIIIQADMRGEPFGISVTSFDTTLSRSVHKETQSAGVYTDSTLQTTNITQSPLTITIEGHILDNNKKHSRSVVSSAGFHQTGSQVVRRLPVVSSLLSKVLPDVQQGVSAAATGLSDIIDQGLQTAEVITNFFSTEDSPNTTIRKIKQLVAVDPKDTSGQLHLINLYHESFGTLEKLMVTSFKTSKDTTSSEIQVYLTLEQYVEKPATATQTVVSK